jgi:hypothetical protein
MECVSGYSTHLNVDVLFSGVWVSELVSVFLSEGSDMFVDVYLVYPWEEGKIDASYSSIFLHHSRTFLHLRSRPGS